MIQWWKTLSILQSECCWSAINAYKANIWPIWDYILAYLIGLFYSIWKIGPRFNKWLLAKDVRLLYLTDINWLSIFQRLIWLKAKIQAKHNEFKWSLAVFRHLSDILHFSVWKNEFIKYRWLHRAKRTRNNRAFIVDIRDLFVFRPNACEAIGGWTESSRAKPLSGLSLPGLSSRIVRHFHSCILFFYRGNMATPAAVNPSGKSRFILRKKQTQWGFNGDLYL